MLKCGRSEIMVLAHSGSSIQIGILQSPPTWVQNANGPVTSRWSAKDLQGGTMERVKWVEDPNTRFIRARGIVGVGVTIRTST